VGEQAEGDVPMPPFPAPHFVLIDADRLGALEPYLNHPARDGHRAILSPVMSSRPNARQKASSPGLRTERRMNSQWARPDAVRRRQHPLAHCLSPAFSAPSAMVGW
jgi:hypothetical protein